MANDTVILVGVKETLDALKQFDKKAVTAFNRVINKELGDAERDARGLVPGGTPMRGWRPNDPARPLKDVRGGAGWPGWNTGVITAGIKKTKAKGKVRGNYTTSAGALINKSAAGAIFEIAGRKTAGVGHGSSQQFLRNLGNRFGKASRLVWRVVDRDAAKIQANVSAAFAVVQRQLQHELEQRRA